MDCINKFTTVNLISLYFLSTVRQRKTLVSPSRSPEDCPHGRHIADQGVGFCINTQYQPQTIHLVRSRDISKCTGFSISMTVQVESPIDCSGLGGTSLIPNTNCLVNWCRIADVSSISDVQTNPFSLVVVMAPKFGCPEGTFRTVAGVAISEERCYHVGGLFAKGNWCYFDWCVLKSGKLP